MSQVPIAFSESPTVIEPLSVEKKLGQGKFKIYEVFSPRHNTNFALKVFPQNTYGTTQYTKEKLMFHLNHPNIIQYIPTISRESKYHFILTEYAKYGDFFEIIRSGLLNNEALIRTYFHQLINGIEHMHSEGLAHLDLKLENLMMGSDCLLKIIDFDQCQPIVERKITSGGTNGYRPPEVMDSTCQNLGAVDIFSAGVLLYAFMAREFPFAELVDPESQNPKSYSCFKNNNTFFWRRKIQRLPILDDADFVTLINGMLNPDPEKRFRFKDIKKSKWYNGPVFDTAFLANEMRHQYEALKMKKEGEERTTKI